MFPFFFLKPIHSNSSRSEEWGREKGRRWLGPHCRRRPAQRRRTLPVSLPPLIHATHSSNNCQTKQRKKEGTECGREKKERRRVGAAGPHRHRRVVPPHSAPCRHRCTPKGERERDTESASRREGLAASSIVLTALPLSSSQPWREHSAAVSSDQKRARDQERNVESATHREALAAAVARRRVLSLLFEQSSSPPFYCSVDPPELLVVAGAIARPDQKRSCFVSLVHNSGISEEWGREEGRRWLGPHCRRRPAQRRRTLPVSLPPLIHATHSSNSCQTKQRKEKGTECGREKKERRCVGAAGPHRDRRVVPPHSTPCRHRCTPKGERERDTESASRREGLAANSIVLTALPPSSSQPWREHSTAVSPDQKRARDQERNVESATHKEALAAAVARRRVLSLLFEQSSSPPFYCSGLPPPLLEISPI
nr:serine/arginine repetitive matrix protein 1-like [Arachis hypogaea]